jgi:hypothetical protein
MDVSPGIEIWLYHLPQSQNKSAEKSGLIGNLVAGG